MSGPITTSHRSSNLTDSPQLMTPSGTPPTFPHPPLSESKLHQLLAHCDCGTHSFDRAERESPEERRMSFGEVLPGLPTPPSSRRPSFLANLPFRQTFSFSTPSSPSSSSFHLHPSKDAPSSTTQTPVHVAFPKSLAMTPSNSQDRPRPPNNEQIADARSGKVERSKTLPPSTVKVAGFAVALREEREKRHFDPSREPKLLGLL